MSSTKEAEYERKIASMKAAIAAKDSALEQQLVAVKKVAQKEAEHAKRRNDGEIADLRATITSLQASLQKVNLSTSCAQLVLVLMRKIQANNERERDLQNQQSELQAKSLAADELRKELHAARERQTTMTMELGQRTRELDKKLEEASRQVEDARKANTKVCYMCLLRKPASLTQF